MHSGYKRLNFFLFFFLHKRSERAVVAEWHAGMPCAEPRTPHDARPAVLHQRKERACRREQAPAGRRNAQPFAGAPLPACARARTSAQAGRLQPTSVASHAALQKDPSRNIRKARIASICRPGLRARVAFCACW